MAHFYKIFLNDTPLIIAESSYTPDGSEYIVPENEFAADISGRIGWFLNHHHGEKIFIPATSATAILSQVQKALHVVHAAGGVVHNDANALLMIFRRGKWDLPKGKVESGESLAETAIREVAEETGCWNLIAGHKLGNSYHVYAENEKLILKETHWYDMKCLDISFPVPQISEGITEVSWVKRSELPDKLKNTYPNIRELIDQHYLNT